MTHNQHVILIVRWWTPSYLMNMYLRPSYAHIKNQRKSRARENIQRPYYGKLNTILQLIGPQASSKVKVDHVQEPHHIFELGSTL
jgi:hypothetical protein